MKAREIRTAFLDYFASKKHTPMASGPLVPPNDPTLMFANAGMVQFKNVFTGKENVGTSRAVTSQKCIRISGKHNDLENVGVTARHHTFFEMLGNFSFGDYFKDDAIAYAWEFITRVLQLPKERLVVTVFGGEGNLGADEEAALLWKKIAGLDDSRIFRFGAKDNFWQMGETGPCGPCSEIHIYLGDQHPDLSVFGEEPNANGHGWIELWNLVFMQFERFADGSMHPLPKPSIDTGMGLERVTAVKQGKLSNYDCDLLRPLVEYAGSLANKKYKGSNDINDVGMRVIADHARMSAFVIAEGVFPDRDGRPYVLRRVMRRAIRFGQRIGIEKPFLHLCTKKVIELMSDAYPELKERQSLIEDITLQEEERFRNTLKRGLELLEDNQRWDASHGGIKRLPGEVAFLLYDTYGFPLDLQEVIGKEQKEPFDIDHEGFEKSMQEAKTRSSQSKVGSEAVGEVYRAVRQKLQAHKPLVFHGYERLSFESKVIAVLSNGEEVQSIEGKIAAELVTQETPFYGESGGQVGDRGWITGDNFKFEVIDTQKPVDGLIVHKGRLIEGRVQVGQSARLEVDASARDATRRNHSATHLLHYALRKVLGPQTVQKGSLVGPERLRFDYSTTKSPTSEQLRTIENLVNDKILLNAPIETKVMDYNAAKASGAIGIFEEKYGDVVRVLTMTADSIELCGGTHASRTGDIGLFKIVSDAGLAAGVRRLEALTGWNTLLHMRKLDHELSEAAATLKSPVSELQSKLGKLVSERDRLLKQLSEQQKGQAMTLADALLLKATPQRFSDLEFSLLTARVDVQDATTLREMAEHLRDKLQPSVIALAAATADDRAILICAVSKTLNPKIRAGDIVRKMAEAIGGGGGGRPDFAQAGGPHASDIEKALQVAETLFIV